MNQVSQSQKLFLARLGVGLAQGLLLYLLYSASDDKVWPATQGPVFAPLLLAGLYSPILFTLALGEMPWRRAALWFAVAAVVIVILAFFDNWSAWPLDWSYGSASTARPHIIPSPQLFFFGGAGLFIAHALIVGANVDHRLVANYPTHFDVAWKMAVQLALAAGFVAAFWLLLWLGAGLFGLIKLDFFRKLIQHEWFAIPAITLAAAGALHLTDIRPALVRGARTLALTLLSWLLPLITLIVAGFLVSLPFTGLAALWSFGHASALLLVAAAALIILINAAYQDGDAERLPPKILRLSGSLGAILPLPLSIIAAYALHLRVAQYGWTVDRIWLAASVCLACGYAAGYVYAAVVRDPWLARIERWNFVISLATLAVLIALFTPIASPARIAVADQMARLQSGRISPAKFDFNYLRWHGGRYGMAALNELKRSGTATVRDNASAALLQRNPGAFGPSLAWPANVKVYPAGQKLPRDFVDAPWNRVSESWLRPSCRASDDNCQAVLADFDDDGQSDILLISVRGTVGQIFHRAADEVWRQSGSVEIPFGCQTILSALQQGHFRISPPPHPWSQIEVAGTTLHIADNPGRSCPK